MKTKIKFRQYGRYGNDYTNIGTLEIDGVAHNVFVMIPKNIGKFVRLIAPFVKSEMKRGSFRTGAENYVQIVIEPQPQETKR